MKRIQQPLVFNPVYCKNIWGGCLIAAMPRRSFVPSPCGESWELSAHPAGTTSVRIGAFKGALLSQLTETFGASLIGTSASSPTRFPLLFKIIDAMDRLSVQVHPNDANASLTKGEPKSEMWYVLDTAPDACVYAGLKPGTDAQMFAAAIRDGTAADRMFRLPVRRGDALYIPGGLVHAIGPGCLIYEVQQSSNTTYRLFDWNRVDASGEPRELHVEKGLLSIDWMLPPPSLRRAVPLAREGRNAWGDVLKTPYFHLRQVRVREQEKIPLDGTTFHALFTLRGGAKITCGGVTVELAANSSCLVPADGVEYSVEPVETETELLITALR
ncbi:MAG: class I mannose-6-phosphate isomerase [Kiritimatiellae bacterium]|nr:class I mannose-6-phosphate isomerase [Kiritimatiellia bacterium]